MKFKRVLLLFIIFIKNFKCSRGDRNNASAEISTTEALDLLNTEETIVPVKSLENSTLLPDTPSTFMEVKADSEEHLEKIKKDKVDSEQSLSVSNGQEYTPELSTSQSAIYEGVSETIETTLHDFDIETTSDQIKSTSDQIETTSDQVETTSDQIETTSDQIETTSDQIETTSDQIETTSDQIETTSDQIETTSDQIETTSDQIETTSDQIETTSDQIETTSDQIETTSDQIETTSDQIETTSDQIETTSDQIETTSDQIETTSDQIETTSDQIETTSDQIETTSDQIETTEEYTLETSSTTDEGLTGQKKLSERILELLEKFKEPQVEGIPGVDILDPCPVPDASHSLTLFDTLYFENSAVYGFSKLHLLYITADFENLEVKAEMDIDHLETRGRYRVSSFLMPRRGPYSVNITGIKFTPRATLGVEINGKLKPKDIEIDVTLLSNETSIAVEFVNLDDLLQGYINSAGNSVFELLKPHILRQTYRQAREDIEKQLEEIAGDIEFPNTIPPLDMILIDIRRKIQELGMDPYKVADYKNSDNLSFLSVSLSHTWITGLATFHRKGDVILRLENNTITANIELGTQELKGTTLWSISAGNLVSTSGTASFSIEYIGLKVCLSQSLDTRVRPLLKDISLDVGNIQARCDGAGTLDYILEFVINVIPNLIRYQVEAAVEGPLKTKLQEELNKVNVEKEIKEALPRIDEMAKQGFKLSFLRGKTPEHYDDDDFFDF